MSNESPTEMHRQSGDATCRLCDEPMVFYNSARPLVTTGYVGAIQDALEHAMRHPSCTTREDYEMEYIVEEGYNSDEWLHYVDLSDHPDEYRRGASLDAISQLARRGLMVNSIEWEPPRLHVVAVDWIDDRRPGMGVDHV